MAKKTVQHPLKTWLDTLERSPGWFARVNGIPFRAIYQHLCGAVKNPHLNVLLDIEDGTKGQVSVQEQATWWRKNRQ